MLEQSDEFLKTEVLDHHGLVAGTCRDIGLIDEINKRIGSSDPRRIVQPGIAVIAMIINGLGFTNRRLYLTPQFFKSKPVQLLLGESIEASDLNDHALGKALDEIAAYGTTKLFSEVVFSIAEKEGLLESFKEARLDSTSFCLHGNYENDKEIETIEVVKGFSKDHRPDLNQVMLSLVMGTEANLPMWMEAQNGNTSDKSSFHETVKNMSEFKKELTLNDSHWIADSAFYTSDRLTKYQDLKWTTRVPENIGVCRKLLEQDGLNWTDIREGYKYCEVGSLYGGMRQRWIIIESDQAHKREVHTLEKKVSKEEAAIKKACWHLGNESFSCESDAKSALSKMVKKFKYHTIKASFEQVIKHSGKGRPKKGEMGKISGIKIKCHIEQDDFEIEKEKNRKGRFIIATNSLEEDLSAEMIFESYGKLQDVERGFGFLKDPWFMVNSFFVKNRSRIQALMMVMTLCLFVYNLTQYRLRKALRDENTTVPNQKGKEFQRPTLKWIFQILEGIAIVHIFDKAIEKWRLLVTNLDSTRKKIICLLGGYTKLIYGFS